MAGSSGTRRRGPSPGSRLRSLALAAGTGAAAVVLAAPTVAVAVNPSAAATSPPPLAQDIKAAKAELATLDDNLDIADEKYRDGQLALAKAKTNQAAAEQALAAGRARTAGLQGLVSRIAASAYETGGQTDVLMATPSGAGQLAESSALLSTLADSQSATLHEAAAAQYDLAVAQTAADQTTATTAAMTKALAADRASILEQVGKHKAYVNSLVDRQHRLEAIAAEKARLARIAAAKALAERRAAARLAAQQAAEAALKAAQKAAADAAAAKAVAQAQAAQRAADRRAEEAAKAAANRRHVSDEATGSSGSSGDGSSADGGSSGASGSIGGGSGSARAAAAVAAAYRELGAPYDWAADGPGAFDCSGLTAYVWAAAGVSLPHSSQAQFTVGTHVLRSDLAPGDLVFFGSPIHHVGIYVGNGDMIDAPQTGDVVRVQSIGRNDYAGAVRVTG